MEWRRSGVNKVLILAEDWEIEENWGNAGYYYAQLSDNGMKYLHVPIPDGYGPSLEGFREIVSWLDSGSNLVHCVGGIGRTGTVIAGYLMVREGLSLNDAVEEVRSYRPGAVQTMQQFSFLMELANRRSEVLKSKTEGMD
ncbi:protein phosphatase [Metallosphaera tengchongensis]|uniref:Protein phosphatase n=2 Tax=Metallosphaera tengchongensis TaxID=1532350 RepID=A0A6N0NQF6_9CREN|nr:dual specificity protein phosphatase family protein [Metallosphaera tengchongensis]QKQ99103.1 protein phosphatase [Metallosphaera tengchongensis]